MVLLSGMMRAAAFTGSRQPIDDWFAGKQWGRWVVQGTPDHLPPQAPRPRASPQPPADPAKSLQNLTQLRDRGVIDDAEFQRLRARLGV
jgi:DNA-binding IclR family transcriptional regulator